MRSKNAVSLIGTVGRDAELRQTQGGVTYATFSLATSTGGYKRRDGSEVPEKTQWHRIVCWDSTADFASKYVRKGMKVDVEGMVTYSEFTDQQGVKRTSCDIVCDDIVLMSQPQGAQNPAPQPPQSQGWPTAQPQGYVAPQQGYVPQTAPTGGYQQPRTSNSLNMPSIPLPGDAQQVQDPPF